MVKKKGITIYLLVYYYKLYTKMNFENIISLSDQVILNKNKKKKASA